MQLPPTILSIDKRRKSGKDSDSKSSGGKKVHENSQNSGRTISEPVKEPNAGPSLQGLSAVEQGTFDVVGSDSEDPDCSETDDVDAGNVASAETLPPTSSNQQSSRRGLVGLRPPRTLETTLFDRLERMYGPSIKRMLNVQYR